MRVGVSEKTGYINQQILVKNIYFLVFLCKQFRIVFKGRNFIQQHSANDPSLNGVHFIGIKINTSGFK